MHLVDLSLVLVACSLEPQYHLLDFHVCSEIIQFFWDKTTEQQARPITGERLKISGVVLSLIDKKVVQEHSCVDNLTTVIQIETQRAPKYTPTHDQLTYLQQERSGQYISKEMLDMCHIRSPDGGKRYTRTESALDSNPRIGQPEIETVFNVSNYGYIGERSHNPTSETVGGVAHEKKSFATEPSCHTTQVVYQLCIRESQRVMSRALVTSAHPQETLRRIANRLDVKRKEPFSAKVVAWICNISEERTCNSDGDTVDSPEASSERVAGEHSKTVTDLLERGLVTVAKNLGQREA
jgi:hypothetical protein